MPLLFSLSLMERSGEELQKAGVRRLTCAAGGVFILLLKQLLKRRHPGEKYNFRTKVGI